MNSFTDFHPKVVGGALGSTGAGVAVWLLSLMHVHVTLPEAAALVGVISAFGGWLAPILNREVPPTK
jgi:hypothetical protein